MNCARLESLIHSIIKLVDYKPSVGNLKRLENYYLGDSVHQFGRIAPLTAPRKFSQKVGAASSPPSGMPKPAPRGPLLRDR
jgi:hypothetical protein